MNFQKNLDNIVERNNSLLCVGLDSDLEKIPHKFKKTPTSQKLRGASKNPQFEFNKWIIEQTHDLVCAYKPNSAFYEAEGLKGILALKFTCHYLKKNYPHIPIILDAKRGDIGSSNKGYIKYAFDFLGVDAITLHPYLGQESLMPFLKLKDKGIFILCKTSNKGSEEIQGLRIGASRHDRDKMRRMFLYQIIAEKAVRVWSKFGNCMLVMGATYPKELAEIRKIIGDLTILVPGIGAQGGDLEKTLKAGLNLKKVGLIINSSRGIIFSKNPRKQAIKLRDEINKYR